VEEYYRLIANLLGHVALDSGTQVTSFYRSETTFAKTLRDLKPLILEDEDSLFNSIGDDLRDHGVDSKAADLIVSLVREGSEAAK
jgi:hypothetical protein